MELWNGWVDVRDLFSLGSGVSVEGFEAELVAPAGAVLRNETLEIVAVLEGLDFAKDGHVDSTMIGQCHA